MVYLMGTCFLFQTGIRFPTMRACKQNLTNMHTENTPPYTSPLPALTDPLFLLSSVSLLTYFLLT